MSWNGRPTYKRKQVSGRPVISKISAIFKRYFSLDIIIGGGLILLLVVFPIWATNRIFNFRNEDSFQPTTPPISSILVSTIEELTASPTSPPGVEPGNNYTTTGETPVMTLPAGGKGAVQVVIIAQEQAWVRITVDGKVKFEGRVTPGSAYSFDGNTQIEVITGNGRAISILYNQNNLGPMGNLGEVVDHIYTANAILNPTATFTLTPTITPTPTITLRPSATPRPSSTPRSTPTPNI